MSAKPTIYTIGHSNHSAETFLQLLLQHGINAIADVRSVPYSRYNPQFGRERLAAYLKQHQLAYVFLGQELGAIRDEPQAYRDGNIDFDRVRQLPAFLHGVQRLLQGAQKWKIAMLCAEKDPLTCHRGLLISPQLQQAVQVTHILSDGSLETHAQAERRLLDECGLDGEDLFRSTEEMIAEAYAVRAAGFKVAPP